MAHPEPEAGSATPAEIASHRFTKLYETALTAAFALTPSIAILYLHLFQRPELRFEHHLIHEVAIGAAIVLSGFIAWVTWRCYESSGEPFLRWLTLGFLAFAVLYAPHGLLTRLSDTHLPLFLLYGPASRLAMVGLFVYGLMQYGKPHEEPSVFRANGFWHRGLIALVLIDLVIAAASFSPLPTGSLLRIALEIAALACALAGIAVMLSSRHHHGSPLLLFYLIALAVFAQSSISFLLAGAWNHQWWLGHTIFAAGFFLLSYGVVQAYHTTRAFSSVYSLADLIRQLKTEKARAEDALIRLERANAQLQHLAATDALTGASNRRDFLERLEAEWARARREGTSLSLLALDLDHFKRINDEHGHAAGDLVLRSFVSACVAQLRPSDVIGRMGGEEFSVLLPADDELSAQRVARRLRATIADLRLVAPDGAPLAVSVSIGCATFGIDGVSTEAVMRRADERLYAAKDSGRNCVVAHTGLCCEEE